MDMGYFTKDYIMTNVFPRLRPQENDYEIGERRLAYRNYLDLLVTYYVPISEMDEPIFQSYQLTIDHLRSYDISEDMIHRKSIVNLERVYTIHEMTRILENFTDVSDIKECLMYVISNSKNLFGAASVMNPKILDYISDILGEPFILLPSSIHEMIAIPCGIMTNLQEVKDMVREVNDTQVEEKDRLSYSVYYYSHGTIAIF